MRNRLPALWPDTCLEPVLVKIRRPNIIVILAASMGAWALGCAGNDEIMTPNLDRLAAAGTRFDGFYATSPASSPARATILTGQIPSQHGIHDWLRGGDAETDGAPAIRYLDGIPTYTQVLANAGYTCGLSGTWQLGDSAHPQQGFSAWFTTGDDAGVGAITDVALDFIDNYRLDERPFYLGIHYPPLDGASPVNAPWEYLDLYATCPFDSIPPAPRHPWSISGETPQPGSSAWASRLQTYFANITAMDAGIGRILDRLDDAGLGEDTIVWFLGDNGFSAGHHGMWGTGNATFPLNMLDTSVRVPAIVRWPGRIEAGVVRIGIFSACDVSHTLLDQVGLEMPDAKRLPGRSFARLLAPESRPDRDHVVVMAEYGPVRMIRTPAWKYVHRFPYGPHELYDMAHDPGERENLVHEPGQSEIVTLLRGELQRWFSRYVNPAVDGVHEQVTGSGQFLRAGTGNEGVLAYAQEHRLLKEDERTTRTPSQ